MPLIQDQIIRRLTAIFLLGVLLLSGCNVALVRYSYVPDTGSDPPLITIEPILVAASASPTVLILSPTPSETVSPSFTPLPTASSAPSPTASWTTIFTPNVSTSTPVWTGLPSLTRSVTPYRLATWTLTRTPPALPTWTSRPPIPYWTAMQIPNSTPTSSPTPRPSNTPGSDSSGSSNPTATQPSGEVTASVTSSVSSTDTPYPTSTPTSSPTSKPTFTTSPTTTAGCSLVYNSSYEAQVLALINAQRASAIPAKDPLSANSALSTSARAHSVDQASHNFMSHTGSDGSSPKDRITRAGYKGNWWGEIIYAGSGPYGTPAQAVTWWMNDPPHAAIILNANYTDFGAGYAYCPGGSWGGFFTVDFGGP